MNLIKINVHIIIVLHCVIMRTKEDSVLQSIIDSINFILTEPTTILSKLNRIYNTIQYKCSHLKHLNFIKHFIFKYKFILMSKHLIILEISIKHIISLKCNVENDKKMMHMLEMIQK